MANPNPDQRGLTPIRPGQVLNTEGRNQYTYKREAEANLEEISIVGVWRLRAAT